MNSSYRLLKLYVIIFTASLLFNACKEEYKINDGDIKFSFEIKSNESGRSKALEDVQYILISISDAEGNLIIDQKEITITKFNGEYLSEAISVAPGIYFLDEFILLDGNNNALYVSPKEESDLAYLVDNPLPISIEINSNEVTTIKPQVIAVGTNTPSEFGYLNFTSLDIQGTTDVFLSVITPNGDSFVMNSAKLTVSNANQDSLFSIELEDKVNIIRFPLDISDFVLQISKEGYQTFSGAYNHTDLELYTQNNVLTITLPPLDLAPILDLPFTGNFDDVSGNNHITTGSNLTPTTDRHGAENSAYYLNGVDSYIEIQNSEMFDLTVNENFSLSIWVAPDETQSNIEATSHAIVSKWDGQFSTGYPYGIWYYNSTAGELTNKVSIQRFGSNYCDQNKVQEPGQVALNLENWNHIVFVQIDGFSKLYQNGTLIAEIEDPTFNCEYLNNDEPIRIGYRNNYLEGAFRHFRGKLDDFKLFDKALSENEIESLYNN